MKPILILDLTCPRPYDGTSLAKEGLGGTEATVIRIAEGLASDVKVVVAQHNRNYTQEVNAVTYCNLETIPDERFGSVIHLRTAITVPHFKEKHPGAKHLVWAHDLIGSQFVADLQVVQDFEVKLLGVSRFHKQQIQDVALRCMDTVKNLRVGYIYNPVVATKSNVDVDPNKLVFFSSPHKGLKETIENFRILKNMDNSFKLYIANPGYDNRQVELGPDVINLGSLTHSEVLKHVESAFAVYYPNFIVPETFGLVMAESNAVGTPVLAHPFGAAIELLNKEQLIDGRKEIEFNQRLLKWKREGRPVVKADPRFELKTILEQWRKELA